MFRPILNIQRCKTYLYNHANEFAGLSADEIIEINPSTINPNIKPDNLLLTSDQIHALTFLLALKRTSKSTFTDKTLRNKARADAAATYRKKEEETDKLVRKMGDVVLAEKLGELSQTNEINKMAAKLGVSSRLSTYDITRGISGALQATVPNSIRSKQLTEEEKLDLAILELDLDAKGKRKQSRKQKRRQRNKSKKLYKQYNKSKRRRRDKRRDISKKRK